ncbi:hypothetical protein A2602_04575, partial [candidate division WWE3 bacterium RIFOXYD1_FULL_40_11]
LLSLNSFLLWNVSEAVLYKIEDSGSLTQVKSWNNLSHLKLRGEVLQHKDAIKLMLVEILNDINSFILGGTIKTVSVVTALSSETVSWLIHNNLSSYVEALKNNAVANHGFSDEITLWWRYAKNDYPEEQDKFVVLGRNNLLFLINKFIFAHILKSYQVEANSIDNINSSTDVETALATFDHISEKCDFWNIFQRQTGEELVTPEVWQDIVSFNALLKEFNFAKIEKNLLHDLLGATIYKNKRKFAGQFTTPQELARFIVRLTIKDKNLHAIDPCCGTGTIVKEIYKYKKTQITVKESLATLWASDKFSLPLQMAMFNLAEPEALGFVLKVFKEDATKLEVDKEITLHEPFKGTAIIEKLPKFGYIISNLPFVQQEDIEVLNPNVVEINRFIQDKLGEGFLLDGRSDLYAYFPFHFWKLLDTDGKMSIIVSNSWLGTAWGKKFYTALSAFFEIENIITSGNGRWFDNAKVVTNIITLRKKNFPSLPNANEIIKFTTTKKALTSYNPEEIEEISAIVSTAESFNESDLSVYAYTHEKLNKVLSLGLNLNSFFANNDWLLELSSKLIKVSELFDIGRGERRGWDKLFYPDTTNGIEQVYLQPVLKTPRSVHTLGAKPDALAFCCDKTKEELELLGHTGALSWINKFEHQENERGIPLTTALARSGTNWYTMSPTTMAEMVTSINFGDRLFFAKFQKPTFVNQRLVRFSKKSGDIDDDLCHSLLNSIVGQFYIEAMGTGRGEGALDLSKDKIKADLRIINPKLFTGDKRDKIMTLFGKLMEREVLPLKQELEMDDRVDFDNAVLEAIGFPLYRERIKTALLTLYNIRASVNG